MQKSFHSTRFVSRGGEKLEHALKSFGISVAELICADFGSSIGGFVDCLLQNGASKVYAVETGYGALEWRLRNDSRVAVMERTNAMHVELPEKVDLITIDAAWTKLEKIILNALKNLKPDGKIITLLKPHYEVEHKILRKGKLSEEHIPEVIISVKQKLSKLGVEVLAEVESPLVGRRGGNREFLLCLKRK